MNKVQFLPSFDNPLQNVTFTEASALLILQKKTFESQEAVLKLILLLTWYIKKTQSFMLSTVWSQAAKLTEVYLVLEIHRRLFNQPFTSALQKLVHMIHDHDDVL